MRFVVTVIAAFACLCSSAMPIGLRTAMWGEETTLLEIFESAFGGAAMVAVDDDDNIVVTLTNDVSGTVEIPDSVGAVTIDLNGHDMVGNGGLGETALPDGPAIRIVGGDGEGETTRLSIVDTSEGEKGQVVGGGESAGIEVAEGVAIGVRLDVDEDVAVLNGDGTEQEFSPNFVGNGTVTVPKTWKTGQKVTWKATADKGSVFARWEGPLVDSLNLTMNERRNPSLAFAVPEGFETNMVTAVFIPIDDDGLAALGIGEADANGRAARSTGGDVLLEKGVATNLWVTDDSQSYVTATASGLPAGLKFNAKTLQITGAPTKSGTYWVQIKAKNASGFQWAENVKVTVLGGGAEAKEPKLTRTAYHPLTVACATEGGTVTGTGVYAEGKKVSVKATAAKGYVFAGWYDTDSKRKMESGEVEPLSKASSWSVSVPETRYLFARFVTVEEDVGSVALSVDGVPMKAGAAEAPYRTNVMCGVYMEWPVAVDSLSLPTVAVAGLPSGLKFTAKDIVDSKTKQVTVPANTIYGAPTAASKTVMRRAGVSAPYLEYVPSKVKVTVATASKAKVVYEIDMTVDALPAWAQGTFDGAVWRRAGDSAPYQDGELNAQAARSTSGQVTLTVAANGKISGKMIDADGTWTLSAASYSAVESPSPNVDDSVFHATVIGKSGKLAFTNEMEVASEEVRRAEGSAPYRRGVVSCDGLTAWQNLWKTEPWKVEAKAFANKTLAIDAGTRDACPYQGTVTLKFAASGAVTATGKFVTGVDARGRDVVYSASCASVLIPMERRAGVSAPYQDEGATIGPYSVFLFFPPKNGKFDGYADEIEVEWDGETFSVRE